MYDIGCLIEVTFLSILSFDIFFNLSYESGILIKNENF